MPISQLKLKLPQQRAQQFINIRRRNRLAYTLSSTKPKVHQQLGPLRSLGIVPARGIENVVLRTPYGGVVVEGVVADCDGGLVWKGGISYWKLGRWTAFKRLDLDGLKFRR